MKRLSRDVVTSADALIALLGTIHCWLSRVGFCEGASLAGRLLFTTNSRIIREHAVAMQLQQLDVTHSIIVMSDPKADACTGYLAPMI